MFNNPNEFSAKNNVNYLLFMNKLKSIWPTPLIVPPPWVLLRLFQERSDNLNILSNNHKLNEENHTFSSINAVKINDNQLTGFNKSSSFPPNVHNSTCSSNSISNTVKLVNNNPKISKETTNKTDNNIERERSYSCPQCAKCFTSNSGLKQHMHIHASFKPFTCQVCHKAYTQFSNLCRHKRLHKCCRQKSNCLSCGHQFANSYSLLKHQILTSCHNNVTLNNTIPTEKSVILDKKSNSSNCHSSYHHKKSISYHTKHLTELKRNEYDKKCKSSDLNSFHLNNHSLKTNIPNDDLGSQMHKIDTFSKDNEKLQQIKKSTKNYHHLKDSSFTLKHVNTVDGIRKSMNLNETLSRRSDMIENDRSDCIMNGGKDLKTEEINFTTLSHKLNNDEFKKINTSSDPIDLSHSNRDEKVNTENYSHIAISNRRMIEEEFDLNKVPPSKSFINTNKQLIKSDTKNTTTITFMKKNTIHDDNEFQYLYRIANLAMCTTPQQCWTKSMNHEKQQQQQQQHIENFNIEHCTNEQSSCIKRLSSSTIISNNNNDDNLTRYSSLISSHNFLYENYYTCNVCFKKFPRAANLNRHIRTHTGEQPYQCPHCDRLFSISSNMQRHIRNIHSRSFIQFKLFSFLSYLITNNGSQGTDFSAVYHRKKYENIMYF
ncbi:unnamed protein product [Schistosoma turkestanicum]|nr:unnamed protein product [Schistosoma turkestanicum]